MFPRVHTFGAAVLTVLIVLFTGMLYFFKAKKMGVFEEMSWWSLGYPLAAIALIWGAYYYARHRFYKAGY